MALLKLLWLAPTLFFLRLFRVMCIKRGVTEVHFRWSNHSIEILQREFTRLIMIYLPAGWADNGLPLGLQMIAPFGADELLPSWAQMLADRLKII